MFSNIKGGMRITKNVLKHLKITRQTHRLVTIKMAYVYTSGMALKWN